MIEPLESIRNALEIADEWQRKGQQTQSLHCVEGALMGYMQHAVHATSCSEALALLRAQHVHELLNRYVVNLREVCALVDAGRSPSSVIAGNYPHLVYSHIAWLFGEFDLGNAILSVARRPDVLESSTQFWCEYSRGVQSLVDRVPYEPAEFNLRGPEKYWASYLKLMMRASVGEAIDAALQEVDDAFRRRNQTGNVNDDSYGIDGCGPDPVFWDFRRDALAAYIRR